MKKTKILAIVLSAAIAVGAIPFAMFLASAMGGIRATNNSASVSPSELPNVCPDGTTIGKTEILMDASTVRGTTHTARGTAKANGEMLEYTTASETETGRNGLDADFPSTVALGASGLMFYMENDASTDSLPGFVLSIGVSASRNTTQLYDKDNGNGTYTRTEEVLSNNMHFDSVVTHHVGGMQTIPDATATYYVNKGDGWVENSSKEYFIGQAGAGWYYIPFDSLYYHGGWNLAYSPTVKNPLEGEKSGDYILVDGNYQSPCFAKYYDSTAYGKTFDYFLDHYENFGNLRIVGVQLKLQGISAKTFHERTITMGDIYFVYPELAGPFENAASCEYLPDLAVHDMEPNETNAETGEKTFTGTFKAEANSGSVTITGNTENDTTDYSGGRVWLESKTQNQGYNPCRRYSL